MKQYLRELALLVAVMAGLASTGAIAQEGQQQSAHSGTEHGSLGELGAKLSDPLSDVWALFTEFDLNFNEGDLSDGDHKTAGAILFQPVMPFKLTKNWKMITRPVIPFISEPIPEGGNIDRRDVIFSDPFTTILGPEAPSFDRKTGLGDIQLPLLFAPNPQPGSKWMLGAGPTFTFPTATTDELGSDKWEAGPALVVSRKTRQDTAGVFGQYWWSYATQGSNKPDTSHGSILYFYYYNLPNAWQIGTNPTATYNDKASSGNKWNVPVGLTVAKTTKFGKLPVKFQLGIEKSIVRQDDYGQDWQVKLNIIPVIPSLFPNPLF